MPQLDFSYYISQITWLALTFLCFFCISKFLILPQLNRILNARSNFIETNINFAQEIINKTKKINQDCDEDIKKNNKKMNEKMLLEIEQLKNFNNTEINIFKKKINEKENKNNLQIKQNIQKISKELDAEIISTIKYILEKIYLIKPDEKKVLELYNKFHS